MHNYVTEKLEKEKKQKKYEYLLGLNQK